MHRQYPYPIRLLVLFLICSGWSPCAYGDPTFSCVWLRANQSEHCLSFNSELFIQALHMTQSQAVRIRPRIQYKGEKNMVSLLIGIWKDKSLELLAALLVPHGIWESSTVESRTKIKSEMDFWWPKAWSYGLSHCQVNCP